MKGFKNFWKFILLFFLVSGIYSYFFGDWLGFSFKDFLPFLTMSIGIVVFGLLDSIQKIDSIVLEKNLSQSSLKRGPDGLETWEKDEIYKEYYSNGVLKCEGEFWLSLKVGVWKEYCDDGNLKETSNYFLGKKSGETRRYSNEGNVFEVITFNDGVIRKKISYLENVKRTLEYFKNGELKINITDSNELTKEYEGVFEQFHQTGELYSRGEDGNWEYYDLRGQLFKKFKFKNNRLEGVFEDFHENGKISIRTEFKKGIKEGLEENFFEDGNLHSKCFYKGNESDGVYESFYENGWVKSKVNYKNGVINGLYEYYYENGKLMVRTNFENGNKEGVQERFKENGKLDSVCTFKNNVEVSRKNQISIWLLNILKF